MLNCKHKTYDKKNSPNHAVYISNDLFALKKCYILHIGNLTSNKTFPGIKLFMNIVLINQFFHTFLEYEINNRGQ